jgi:predicted  nucleic acid-binding Zn-ribbon protein
MARHDLSRLGVSFPLRYKETVMSFMVADLHDLIQLLERQPAWLTDVRRVVLTKELLALPEQLAQLQHTTAHELQQLTTHVATLTGAQRHTDEQLQQLTTQMAALTSAQSRTEERLTSLVQAQSRTEERLTSLVQAQSRTEERLTSLVQAQSRTDEQLQQLTTQMAALTGAQSRTDEQLQQLTTQMAALTGAQSRTDEQLQQLTTQMAALTGAQSRTEVELRQVVSWQRGEAGRRDGERYERDIVRQAPALFNGGQGGPTDDATVQQRLATQLGALLGAELLDASANPLLLDLVWWKGAEMAVAEVSRHVDRQDVNRVAQRADMLRRSGAQVIAFVIGEQWATDETREEAQSRQVEWKVGSDLSAGFLTFRQR